MNTRLIRTKMVEGCKSALSFVASHFPICKRPLFFIPSCILAADTRGCRSISASPIVSSAESKSLSNTSCIQQQQQALLPFQISISIIKMILNDTEKNHRSEKIHTYLNNFYFMYDCIPLSMHFSYNWSCPSIIYSHSQMYSLQNKEIFGRKKLGWNFNSNCSNSTYSWSRGIWPRAFRETQKNLGIFQSFLLYKSKLWTAKELLNK